MQRKKRSKYATLVSARLVVDCGSKTGEQGKKNALEIRAVFVRRRRRGEGQTLCLLNKLIEETSARAIRTQILYTNHLEHMLISAN